MKAFLLPNQHVTRQTVKTKLDFAMATLVTLFLMIFLLSGVQSYATNGKSSLKKTTGSTNYKPIDDLAYDWSGNTSVEISPRIPISWDAKAGTTCTVKLNNTEGDISICYGINLTVDFSTSGATYDAGAYGPPIGYYSWDGGGWIEFPNNSNGNGSHSQSSSTLSVGTHTFSTKVTAYLSDGYTLSDMCQTDRTVTVKHPATAGTIALTSASTLCQGTAATVGSTADATLNGCAGTLNIQWYRWNGTAWTDLGTLNTQTLSDVPPGPGTYYYLRRAFNTANGINVPASYDATSASFTVNQASTIALTSAPGTQNQVVCSPNAINTIIYTYGGGATNASVNWGAITGLSYSVNTGAKTVTITGNPTNGGTYSVTTSGSLSPCVEVSIGGTITYGNPVAPTIQSITNPQ